LLHYESLGLLTPCGRTAAGYRLYSEAELERLRAIRRLRDAGLSLVDIRHLLTPAQSTRGVAKKPAEILEKRLLDLCHTVERLREQQRSLARLLITPGFRDAVRRLDKAAWVALLRRAGFTEDDMFKWHAEFERDHPHDHAAFLKALGLSPAEIAKLRRWSRTGKSGQRRR
jgi:DNA-binding transcriptional MerR regulator